MFFLLSKIFWVLFTPSTLLLAVSLEVILVVALNKPELIRRIRPVGIMLSIIWILIMVLPLGDWALGAWENYPAPKAENIDGIIVLGGVIDPVLSHERNAIMFGDSAERLTVLPGLIRQYPQAKIVFTGGSGSVLHPNKREVDYAESVLQGWGLDHTAIIFERESRNTHENAIFSKKLAKPQADELWLLVTSAAHMRRAHRVFTKANWETVPFPVDYRAYRTPFWACFCARRNLQLLDQLSYEIIGTSIYKLTGKA